MPKSNILNRIIAEEYIRLMKEAKGSWTWKYNIWNIDSPWIDKLQKGKMGSASKTSTPFKFVSSSGNVATEDKGLVSKYLNKNHVVLQYYPKEEGTNVSNRNAVSKSGVKKITNIMKKELSFKLKTTLKGKKEDMVSSYLVFHDGDNRLTKDWKYGQGKFKSRRDNMEYEWENPPKGMLYPNGTLFEKAIKGKDAGNYIKMAPKGRKLTMNGKTYICLGKGKWKGPDGEKLNWVEVAAMASALGNKKVIYEAKLTKAHSKKIQNVLDRKNLSVEEVKPNQNFIFVSYTNYKDRSKIQTIVSEMGYKYEADGRSTNAPRIIGIAGHNWMQFSKGKIKEGRLNEISVKAGFDDIKKGITTSIDGVKMSKDMVAAIMDWMAMSAYGRKYHKQIMKGSIHSLLKPADAWGIERFLKTGKLKKEWKAIIKKHKPKREGVNEQSQFFGPDKVTPPKRKIDKRILNVPIYDETPEEVDARRARIAQKNLEQDRITNLKDELGGSFGPFVKKDSWAHKVNQAINAGELDPSREDWDDHATQWKSHVGDMKSGIDPVTYTLGKDPLEEGVPFPQTTPNEFAFFDFKKWAWKNRGKLKKELLKHKDRPGKLWDKLSMIWMEWGKKTNNKEFTRIKDQQKFGRALAIMLKKENVLFDKNPSPSHKIVVKEQSWSEKTIKKQSNLVDMMKDADTAGKLSKGEIEIPNKKKYFKPTDAITNPKPVTGLGGDHLMKNLTTIRDGGSWLLNKIGDAISNAHKDGIIGVKPSKSIEDRWKNSKTYQDWKDSGKEQLDYVKDFTNIIEPMSPEEQKELDDYLNLINNPPKKDSVTVKKKTVVAPVKKKTDDVQVIDDFEQDDDDETVFVLGMQERHIKKLEEVVFNKAMNIYRKEKLSEQGILKVANFIKKTVKPLIDKFTGNDEPEAQDIEKTEDRWYEPKPEPTDSVIDIMIKKEIKEQMSPSRTKFLSGQLKLKRGDKITYDQHFQFGKVSKNVTAKVVAVKGHIIFLDKGPELDLRQDTIKKINGKTIK